MNNAWTVIFRRPCVAIQPSPRTPSSRLLPQFSASLIWSAHLYRSFSCTRLRCLSTDPKKSKSVKSTRQQQPPRNVASPTLHSKLTVIRAHPSEISRIFGTNLNSKLANTILSELQSRRVSGSLIDVGVNVHHITEEVTNKQALKALEWLRQKYPVDEAAAAEEYAELEEEKYRKDFEAKALKSLVYMKDDTNVEEKVEQWDEAKLARWKEQAAKIEELEKTYAKEQEEVKLAVVQQHIELGQRRDNKLMEWDKLEKQAELDAEQVADENRSTVSSVSRHILNID
jgi:rhomboid-like protein